MDGGKEVLTPVFDQKDFTEGFILRTEIPPGRRAYTSAFAMERRPLPENAKICFLQPLSEIETRRFCKELYLELSTI